MKLPEKGNGFATLVWFHGGGLSRGNKNYPENINTNKIAIATVNYRLSGKGASCPDYIYDAAAAVACVIKNIEKYPKPYAEKLMIVQENQIHYRGELKEASGWIGDFGEYFEWADGNPEGEDRVGYMVQLNEDKIELAESLDNCIGIITGTGAFVADAACLDWHGRYLKDKWGRNIYALTGVLAENPEYDPTKEYIPREYRKEWSPVGLVGKILVRQDGTLKPNGFVGCVNGIATDVDKSSWRVLKVIDEEIALVLIK